MFDLLERTELLMEDSRLYASIVRGDRGERDPAVLAFTMVHNKTMITREMLQFYYRLWTGPTLQVDVDGSNLESEMAERAVYLGKMLFVEVLSAIEHCAKKVAAEQGIVQGPLSLRFILDSTMAQGLMTADRNREWNDIITVRNLAVHDNSVSDRSKRCVIGTVTLSMRPNRMMKGPLSTFIELARISNQYFYEWLSSVRSTGRLDEGNV